MDNPSKCKNLDGERIAALLYQTISSLSTMTISQFAEGNSGDSTSTVDDGGVSPMNSSVDDGANDDSIDGQNSDDSYQLVESTEDKSAKENSPSATRDMYMG